jgi:CRISPR-associated protein Csa5
MHQGDMMESASKLISREQLLRIDHISRLLAVLLAESRGKNYAYIDRLGYSQSKDLAVFYIREALRDFHSINNRGWKNKKAEKEASKIEMNLVNKGIEDIGKISEMKELRERVSLITAKALTIAISLIEEEETSSASSSLSK